MGYLISADYNRQIQTDNINQIIGNDTSILTGAELAAESELKSYLVQKYDVAKEFRPTLPFSELATYKGNDLVTYGTAPNIKLYYVTPPAEEFDYKKYYSVGDVVSYKDKTYTCRISSSSLSHEAALQYLTISNLPYGNVFPDDPANGVQYWGTGTPYSITGDLPTDNTKWTQGDNRNQQLVMYMVDVVLYHIHSRIAPRNIPQLRMDRYDAAISWLKNVAKGDDITADIPRIQPKRGNRIRYGGNVKNINTY